MTKDVRIILGMVRNYFNITPDRENEEETVKSIRDGVSFRGATLWVLVFAIFIASLGLNVNSTAVIIGAMLISPLMGPIIGMGLAIGINDFALLKRSIRNYLIATVISVITAAFYFLISPLDEVQSELLARTSPTFYDVLIALCGGAAGIVAIATKGKGNVLPGVAIATALMPPLCTAGYGIAIGNAYYFFGAFYLFFINTVFISLATYLGVRMMKFKQKEFVDKDRRALVKKYILFIVFATMLPTTFMTYRIVKRSIMNTNINKFVNNEFDNKGSHVVSYDVNTDSMLLSVVSVGREMPVSTIKDLERKMAEYKMTGFKLRVIQGYQSDSVMMSKNIASKRDYDEEYVNMVQNEAANLRKSLGEYMRYDDLGRSVTVEARELFPNVDNLSLSLAAQTRGDTVTEKKYVIAVVDMKEGKKMVAPDRQKLQKWLLTRTNSDSLRLVTANQ